MPKDNESKPQVKRGMTDFEANKEGFPRGLRHCVSEIRTRHPHIQHIGVWHALVSLLCSTSAIILLIVNKLGYWGGISPIGAIAKEYKTRQVRTKDGPMGGTITVVDADDVHRFYEDFYRYLGHLPCPASRISSIKASTDLRISFLRNAGVDSVKTDAQFFLDELDLAEDRKRLTKAYQDAWMINSLRHFSIKAISCRGFLVYNVIVPNIQQACLKAPK